VWRKADGEELFVCESAIASKDEEGNVLYYEGTVEDITERKKAEEKLLIYQKSLRSMALELSLAEERLKRRLATDVHDHIGQNLAMSKIKLESLKQSIDSPPLADALEEVSKMLAETIESTRSLTFELSPPVLYELGFEAAVEWLVRKTRAEHGILAVFRNDGRPKPLDNDVRVLLFQAVRELLINVAKHAKAQNVTVSARRRQDEILVTIEDDGVGFDPSRLGARSRKNTGFGLFSVRERLGHIGGRLDIDSNPNAGTRVTLTAPINQESETSTEEEK
ncbi:MAG: sensor histidine kinase, partial [Planctomycetota bacterium]